MPRNIAKQKPKNGVASLRRRLSSIEARLAEITAEKLPMSVEPKPPDEPLTLPVLPQRTTIPSRRAKSDEAPVFELREISQLNPHRHKFFSFHDNFHARLIDELRFAWLCSKWSRFEQLDLRKVEEQEDRELIAALAAAAYVHMGRRAEARKAMQAAIAWGLEPAQAATLIMADLHRTMARAHYINRNHHACEEHLRSSGLAQYTTLETRTLCGGQPPISEEDSRDQRGYNMSDDIRRALPDYEVQVIFDVGANEGQTVKTILQQYPNARIYCFEPGAAAYETLSRSYGTFPQIALFKKAIGAEKCTATLEHGSRSTMSRIVGPNNRVTPENGAPQELVQVDTMDTFCAEYGIDHIDFLKVDTEGHELEVLRGAQQMLRRQAVDLISLEAAMSRLNRRHCALEDLKHHLEDRGYHLFGLYEQKHEWISKQPHLRRSNVLFISTRLVEESSGHIPVSLPDRGKKS